MELTLTRDSVHADDSIDGPQEVRAKEQAPGPLLLLAAAQRLAVILRVIWTRSGLQEITEAHVSLGTREQLATTTGLSLRHLRPPAGVREEAS